VCCVDSKLRPIEKALLKYGPANFTLEVIVYCDKKELIQTEQYYLNLLAPEYNVLKHAYSLLGYKHTKETLNKLRNKIISEDHKILLSSVHKGKVVSQNTRNKLALATTNYRKNNTLIPESFSNLKNKTLLREGVPVTVLNTKTSKEKHFTSQTEAGVFLGISRQAIYNAIKRNSYENNIYKITKK